eukprot:CAMPEP_0114322252 /NCGR_PEP_ID=MMETSP0059-20121206/27119_1 /TAXON_ID=36894 /ORGANISM="Pyramimonas parkeae, Strain CCMP726" /LENGTH=66 /DNA_ID=CAMNT_0001450201 /DNA_START=479 /DNA_END=676 /DNA_ORIENTATION=-
MPEMMGDKSNGISLQLKLAVNPNGIQGKGEQPLDQELWDFAIGPWFPEGVALQHLQVPHRERCGFP